MSNNFNNKEEYSRENGNLEVVKSSAPSNSRQESFVDNKSIKDEKSKNIIIGTLNVFSSPLKKRHEKHYKESTFHFIADIVLVLIIVGLAFAWYLASQIKVEEVVDLVIKSEKSIVVGAKLQNFEIEYKNKSDKTMQDSNITVSFPRSFLLDSVMPEEIFDATSNTFRLGNLESGANGKVKIRGAVFGDIGVHQSLSSVFNFNINNKKESVLNSLMYLVEDSALDISLSFPGEVYSGTAFTSTVILSNTSNIALNDVELHFDSDNKILIKKVDCGDKCEVQNDVMYFPKIDVDEKIEVELEEISSSDIGLIPFVFTAFASDGNNKFKQVVVEKNMTIREPGFQVEITPRSQVINTNKVVNYHVNYKNNENNDIDEVKIKFISNNDNFIINKFENNKNFSISDGVLHISDKIKSGDEASFDLGVYFSRKHLKENQKASLISDISYVSSGKDVHYQKSSAEISVLSNLKVISKGLYYSPQGDQLGVGPIPPIVDVPTSYWIYWEFTNFGNDLSDFTMTADLPEGVVWTGNKSLLSGKLEYAEISRRILWTVDDVAKSNGEYKARFEVSVIPSAFDVGDVLNLIQNTEYNTFDTFCNQKIINNLKNIDTNLVDDRMVAGKGEVVSLK